MGEFTKTFKSFKTDVLVRLLINIFIFTFITQLYTVFLELKISFSILFFNALFVFLFNLPLTVIVPFFLTFGMEKNYKTNNYETTRVHRDTPINVYFGSQLFYGKSFSQRNWDLCGYCELCARFFLMKICHCNLWFPVNKLRSYILIKKSILIKP